ncbi:OST-HTH/LOTUS domain [Popillia japonica]|uniref:OST-HTH/LOTUS domain n=1 Tax=Popillia japonica TaxID=7064 RepID=A0AAW1LU63_POPJA
MSAEERKEVATIISSILTSSVKKMTIQQLNKEYRNTVGYWIPYEKFGCANLEQFLRTLTDKIQIHGSGIHAEVQVLINSKTAHINELISRQRVPRGKPSKAFNRRYPPPQQRSFVKYANDRNYTHNNITNQNTYVGDTRIPSKNDDTALPVTEEFRGAIPKQITQENNHGEDIYFSDEENKKNLRVPYIIQQNLKRLIKKYPDGIMCSSILEFYKNEYRRSLIYTEYGYRSVAEMCVDLRDIFKVVQLDKSDIKLFSRDLTIPEDTLNTIKKFQLMKIKASREAPSHSAIPHSEIDDIMCEIFTNNPPVDIVEFGTELEKQWISPDTNEQDYVDVNVAEVYDPSKFWLNLRIYASKLNELMDNLQIFYSSHNKELQVPNFAMQNNMYIVCLFNREYHRARIIDTSQKSENYIKVYFVDYGTVSVISVESVCYLHNKFSDLPEQAVRARLAGIYPARENEQWSRAAATRFLSLVMEKNLVAQIVKIDEERRILDVVLADTSDEEEDFYLNDALVSMGYALFTFEKREPASPSKIVPIVRYIHLFPTHVELENGSVPTATQSICMHQAGMAIEHMYPHYFKDAETGKPISILEASSEKSSRLIDYEIEQPYFEEENEENTVNEETHPLNNFLLVESETSYRWEDVIEQAESSPAIESGSIIENAAECYSPTNTDTTCCYTTPNQSPQEFQEDKGTQTLHSMPIKTDKHNTTDRNLQGSVTDAEAAVKKPLRPPPGYNHIIPHNTSVTYNYNKLPQSENPHHQVTNQTYINFPIMYPYQAQQYVYNPYYNLYMSMQQMLQMGNKLKPEQQNYLQSLNYNNPNYSSYNPYYNNYNMQHNYPYQPPYPTMEYGSQNYANMNYSQEHQNVMQPNPTVSHNYANMNYPQEHQNVMQPNPTVNVDPKLAATNLEIANIPLPMEPCKNESETDPVEVKTEEISGELEENKLETDADKVCGKNVVKTETEHQIAQIEDSPLPEAVEEADTKTELNSSIENEEPPISSNCDASELESVYEDCTSNEGVKDESTTILQEDVTYKTKLITSMSIGELNLHVINHENEYYFLLAELSKRIFGKTLTALHIRKLMVGTPYIISVVDIRLKTNPKLKNELLMYDLIAKNEVVVDAIPIKYLKDLTTMVTTTEDSLTHINDLLKGVDYFLTGLNLENAEN